MLVTIATVLLGFTHNTVVEVGVGQTIPPGCVDIETMWYFFYHLELYAPIEPVKPKRQTQSE